jgi:hypothetical protein
MKRTEVEAILRGVTHGVREYMGEIVAPLIARNVELERRLAALEARPAPAAGRDGVNGKDADPLAIAAELAPELERIVADHVARLTPAAGKDGTPGVAGKDGPAGRDGLNGKDADPAAIAAELAPELERIVAEHVARLPVPAAGKDGAPGRDGIAGKDADPAAIAAQLAPELDRIVAEHVARLPVPAAGKDGAAGRDGVAGKDADPAAIAAELERIVAEHVARLPVPDAGKDGTPGRDGIAGKDADPAAIAAQLAPELERIVVDHIARLPVPVAGKDGVPGEAGRDGKDGRDGRDGKDADMTIAVELVRNEMARQIAALDKVKGDPGVSLVDRGVYKTGETYQPMNVATFGGSLWIAQEETAAKPGESKAWRLAVKCGRDGRDADPKEIARAVADAVARMKAEDAL